MRLTAENLSARRGEDLLFAGVSFEIEPGEGMLVTGRNGSGKSTLLRVVAGLLRPDNGRVLWHSDRSDAGTPAAEACHYLGHRNAMKPELSVRENLLFWKNFFAPFERRSGVSVDEAAEAVGLLGIVHLPFGYLSAGQQRRMAFAKLMLSPRPVWLLDEPTAALDTAAEALFTDLIKTHLGGGGIVMAATHQPLGLDKARELKMSGFAGVTEEVW